MDIITNKSLRGHLLNVRFIRNLNRRANPIANRPYQKIVAKGTWKEREKTKAQDKIHTRNQA